MSTESSSSAPIEKRSVSAEPADFIELINAPSTEPSNTETGKNFQFRMKLDESLPVKQHANKSHIS